MSELFRRFRLWVWYPLCRLGRRIRAGSLYGWVRHRVFGRPRVVWEKDGSGATIRLPRSGRFRPPRG